MGCKEVSRLSSLLQDLTKPFKKKKLFTVAKKELYIQTRLPYELVEQYERPQVLQLMAATYLRTIQRFDELKIKDFNHQQFAKDVEELFEAQGWLVPEQV